MTSIDPSHFPQLAHRSGHTGGPATARPRSISTTSSTNAHSLAHPLPPIPDLRFEQSFLKTISPYLTTRRTPTTTDGSRVAEKKTKGGIEGVEEKTEEEGAVEVIGIQWSKVLYIVTRDQMVSPLVQGLVWGAVQIFVLPLGARIWSALGFTRSLAQQKQGQAPTKSYKKGDGELTRRLRDWSRSLTGGVEANVALAK